jgi:hypothetical protein
MTFFRRFLIVFAVLASLAGISSTRALALAPPPCNPLEPDVVQTAHFNVWYSGDPTATNYATQSEAGALGAYAEQAYATDASLGFPAPFDNGATPPRDDIYVFDLSPWGYAGYTCYGSFLVNTAEVGADDEAYSVGFHVFEEIELNLFNPSTYSDNWLLQGAAAWASWKALGFPPESAEPLGPWDMALNCYDTFSTESKCSKNGYEDDGESRWPFYEYLAERFSPTFLIEALQDAQTADDSLAGLQTALVAHGTTLTAAFSAYSTKLMAGGWTAPSLAVSTPATSGTVIQTGAATGDVAPQFFAVDHLGTRFVEIDRGDGSANHACFAATLTITVQIPAGVTSQPAFYWNDGSAPIDLAVSGSTATTTVPWDTCNWTNKGFVSLPNATTDIDGKKFSVATHIVVDPNTPATAKLPPTPASPFGQVINVSALAAPPSISIFGPQLLTLSAAAPQIRLIVESNGEGSVRATLGSVSLGSASVRPGENDVRFTVPTGVLTALRSTASVGATLLTLTPVSLDGTVSGPAVTQKLSVTPAKAAGSAKPQTPAKKKTTKKAKAKKATVKRQIKSSVKAKTK